MGWGNANTTQMKTKILNDNEKQLLVGISFHINCAPLGMFIRQKTQPVLGRGNCEYVVTKGGLEETRGRRNPREMMLNSLAIRSIGIGNDCLHKGYKVVIGNDNHRHMA